MEVKDIYPLMYGHSDSGTKELHGIDELSDYICSEGLKGDLKVTLPNGSFLLDTYGPYLNRIADMDYRTSLLQVLVPKQQEMESRILGSAEEYDDEDLGELDDMTIGEI